MTSAESIVGGASLRDRRMRYLVFFSTYFYQGLIAGFSLTALANHYAGLGLPASEIGLHFAVAGLPWTAQPIVWGPLIDRANGAPMGRRRFLGVGAILASQICLGGLCLVPGPPSVIWVGLVFFAHSAFASLLDTACDRMIMDHVPDAELGKMSGCTRGGFVLGTGASTGLFSWMLSQAAFSHCALALLALSTLAVVPMLIVRELPGDALVSWTVRAEEGQRSSAPSFGRYLSRLLIGLRRPSALRLLALCFGVDFALSLFDVRFSVDMVQSQGWDAGSLSRLQAGFALVSGTLGALGIGIWSDKAGPLPALTSLFFGGAAAFLVTGTLASIGVSAGVGPAIVGLTTMLPTLVIVALVPALMQASRDRVGAATQFEVFMATMNLGSVAGGALSGAISSVSEAPLGFFVAGVFVASALLSRRPDLMFGQSRKHPREDGCSSQ